MAHNLEIKDGQASMFYNRKNGNPWHDLGVAVEDCLTAEDALKLSRQNFEVVKEQLSFQGALVPAWAVFRTDNWQLLGTCGEDYSVIQNAEQFRAIDYLLEASGGAHYDTAGVLGHGERVWALARIPEADITVAGKDRSESYLLACTSHDGSLAFTLKLCAVRVVCHNTLSLALSSNGAIARIKHTKNAMDRVEAATRYMSMVKSNARSLEEKLNILAQRRMTRESMTNVLDRIFPKSHDSDGKALPNQTKRENILADVLSLYESNDGNAIPEVRGTAFNLLNAVTEYTDHQRSCRLTDNKLSAGYNQVKARAESAYFGSGESLKAKALEIILEDTKGNPVAVPAVEYFQSPNPSPFAGKLLLDSIIDSLQ